MDDTNSRIHGIFERFTNSWEYKNLLRFALGYAIVNIQRESHRSGSTRIMTNYCLVGGKPSLLRIVAAISFFPCKSDKSNWQGQQ